MTQLPPAPLRALALALILALLAAAPAGAGERPFGPGHLVAGSEAFTLELKGSLRGGVYHDKGVTRGEWRLRFDWTARGRLPSGLRWSVWTRFDVTESQQGPYSGVAITLERDFWKIVHGNTTGAVAAAVGVWGCAVGYRGASCADMVANLTPGGWTPVMTVSSSTGPGPGLTRVGLKVTPEVSVALSGGGQSDPEAALVWKRGNWRVGLGWDGGPGTQGGWTVTVDRKLPGTAGGDVTLGLDAGHYGGVTNLVASAELKRGQDTFYAYASRLGGTLSAGVSWRRKIRDDLMFGTGVESVGGRLIADAGLVWKF